MKRMLSYGLLLSVAFVAGACRPALKAPSVPQPRGKTMPIYVVTEPAIATARVEALADALDIRANVRTEQGVVQYVGENFLSVPTKELGTAPRGDDDSERAIVLQGIDFEALQRIKAPAEQEVAARFEEALRKGEVPIFGNEAIQSKRAIGHSRFLAVDANGEPLIDAGGVALDTHVSFALSLNGVPLIGPGAEVKAVFDHRQKVALLRIALRGVKRGADIPIISDAVPLCQAAFRSSEGAARGHALQVQPTLVYYSPSPEITTVQALYPHYVCEGTILIEDRKVLLRRIVVPAILDAPKVDLSTDVARTAVTVNAKIVGGTAPYTLLWNTPGGGMQQTTEPWVRFDASAVKGRAGRSIGVLVRDANGLQAQASTMLTALTAAPQVAAAFPFIGSDVGTEWIGDCGGLGGSAANARGFISRFGAAGVPARFEWGNEDAWQRDFLDTDITPTGLDQDYVDRVDFTFYTGHASGEGFSFCSDQNTRILSYTDRPKWGDRDLEWLTIAACGPLQLDSGGQRWWQRWGPAFDGLHLFMGYQTVTFDNEREGTVLARGSADGMTILQAWISAAVETQSENEIWAVMGVIGPNGMTNWNDHFWDRGSVGPDIRSSDIRGYWMTHGPS